jgi:tetratricopeptide (TPR) repeat protein
MDIPAIRFLLPCFVLYAFYWVFALNPFIDEGPDKDDRGISMARVQKLTRVGEEMVQKQRYSDALGVYVELHQAYPENSVYIDQLAGIYHKMGKFEQEAAMWEQFLTYAPLPADGCPQIGVAYRNLNREDDALKALQRCVALEAKSDSLLLLGIVLEGRGKYKEADDLYAKALLRAPDYTDVLIAKARCEARLGKPSTARDRMIAVLEKQPDNADALLAMGMASMKLGKISEARRYLKHGSEIRPGDRDFAMLLGRPAHRNSKVVAE